MLGMRLELQYHVYLFLEQMHCMEGCNGMEYGYLNRSLPCTWTDGAPHDFHVARARFPCPSDGRAQSICYGRLLTASPTSVEHAPSNSWSCRTWRCW